MEKLKSIIPWELKKTIQQSNPNDLLSTCSSLHDFFSQSPLFHSMIEDLTNTQLGYFAKNKESALELKNKGNACFSAQNYSQALNFYSQALRVAPFDAVDKHNKLVATLYVNRAASLHKLNNLESVPDCNRALSINPRYAKAWYRRGKAKMSLLNCEEAISDLKVAMNMEGTCSGKRQIESDMISFTSQIKSGTSAVKLDRRKMLVIEDEIPQAKIQSETTPTKGRGMVTRSDIPPASLLHLEEPYAAIILKKCRETHCHFCFNELPADMVPCTTCSMPLYCSEDCLLKAGGEMSRKCLTHNSTDDLLSGELRRCFPEVSSESESSSEVEFTEHGHECHGVNWPTVLPSEVVLAGRILVKLLESRQHSYDAKKLDLSHNYVQLLPESKVELHVYSTVLLYCLYHSYGPKVELNGAYIAKIVVLISQVKINSMAVVRMKSQNKYEQRDQRANLSSRGDSITSNLEQVRVGQAIYLSGSLFNHSCVPNIHAYFISRTLVIRTTEFVYTGCPLELSYGPEVGQLDYRQRQQFLQDNYSFECGCDGCASVNFPDLVLNSFRGAKPNCHGVVLDHFVAESERQKVNHFRKTHESQNLEQKHQVDKLNNDGMKDIAPLMFKQSKLSNHSLTIQPACCLKCGAAYDLKSLHAKADEAEVSIHSLREAVLSNEFHADYLSDALSHLVVLKTVVHPYNKKLAKAHDILAEAFCSAGQTQRALDHCIASIKILKKIYRHGHIALGNELLKLSSLQLAVDDTGATDTVNQMSAIFSNYYGRHAEVMCPYLKHLKVDVQNHDVS